MATLLHCSYKKIRFLIAFGIVTLTANPVFSQVFTSSNLPIVIINTDGNAEIPDDPRVLANMKIIYKGEGVTNFLADQNTAEFLNYNGRIDIEIRGSSSQSLPKKQYGLTTRLADNISNNNVSLLGMPSENDWILNGLAFDPSLIRDYLSYNLARALGNYATRTQFCEVVINGEYKGLYILQEKVKADSERVNVTKITAADNTMPKLTGGYITKADKTTGGDPVAWTMNGYAGPVDFIHELPKPEDVISVQNIYINSEFTKLQTNAGANNISLANGYPSIIDVPSFVDYMLSVELASNADSYSLSTYFHKDRNGKLRAGPIWDFNLTYGNDLFLWGFDRSHYNVWQFADGGNDGPKFWKDLFDNPQFKCYLSKRWNELTQPGQPMNLATINTFIDATVNYISAAAIREDQKWGTVVDLQFEILKLKTWLANRVTWMTNQLGTFSACSNVAVPSLVITKINYNPNTGGTFTNSNDQEFIEIKNIGNTTVNLTGIYFRGTGFVYQFPANQTLSANASVYLASKSTVFLSRYGFAANGEFTRNLANSNQDLVLADGFGNVIDRVHYYDIAPWPNADGNGNFLQLSDVSLDNNLASSWTAVNMNTLSVSGLLSQNFVTLSPNPAKNHLFLNTPNPITAIWIFDMTGKFVADYIGNSNEMEIDISKLSAGIYLVKVESGNQSEIKKFLKL